MPVDALAGTALFDALATLAIAALIAHAVIESLTEHGHDAAPYPPAGHRPKVTLAPADRRFLRLRTRASLRAFSRWMRDVGRAPGLAALPRMPGALPPVAHGSFGEFEAVAIPVGPREVCIQLGVTAELDLWRPVAGWHPRHRTTGRGTLGPDKAAKRLGPAGELR